MTPELEDTNTKWFMTVWHRETGVRLFEGDISTYAMHEYGLKVCGADNGIHIFPVGILGPITVREINNPI